MTEVQILKIEGDNCLNELETEEDVAVNAAHVSISDMIFRNTYKVILALSNS